MKRPSSDFAKAPNPPKKPKLVATSSKQLLLRVQGSSRPNDSGLDKTGIDKTNLSCGPNLNEDSFALAQEDGNVSWISPKKDVCQLLDESQGEDDHGNADVVVTTKVEKQDVSDSVPTVVEKGPDVDASAAMDDVELNDPSCFIPQVDGLDANVSNNKSFNLYPSLLCTNLRSLIPKIDCLCSVIEQEAVGISFISELWLKDCNPLYQRELDRRLNLEGLEFFTNSRGAQRGGGVGIIVNKNLGYSGQLLQVNSRVGRNKIEVVWVLVSPPTPVNGVEKIVCACIYSPPKSKLDQVLLDHLQFNISSLTARYPGSGIVLGGDVNNLSIPRICNTFPDLVNLVASPTRGNRILDV